MAKSTKSVSSDWTGEVDAQSAEFRQSTRISGAPVEAGDSLDVYPFEKRHLVAAGLAEGSLEDTASPAEKEQGNLEVLKPLRDQEAYVAPEDYVWHQGEDEGVVAGEEGSNVSGDAKAENQR